MQIADDGGGGLGEGGLGGRGVAGNNVGVEGDTRVRLRLYSCSAVVSI